MSGLFHKTVFDRAILLSKIVPEIPAMIEAIRIPYLACSIKIGFLKASPLIKRDMVNPTPPKSATPVICFHPARSGKLLQPVLTKIQVNNKIPINLPKTNPVNTPMETGLIIELNRSAPIIIPELARANNGMITKATHGCRLYSIFWSGVSAAWLRLFTS